MTATITVAIRIRTATPWRAATPTTTASTTPSIAARAACHDLTDDDNPARHEAGEVEHGGGDGGHHDDVTEMHDQGSCTPPVI
jgi:hypothetical protein